MPRDKDIPSLTGLRGVAACSVLFGHAVDSAFWYDQRHVHPFAAPFAYFGMSLFFVLSGFVIHYNYADLFAGKTLRIALKRFFVARFARLYPLYAVSIVCSLPMIPLPFAGWIALSYLTMTQSWFNVESAVFPPAWSISTEWFFYLTFVPLTGIVIKLRSPLLVFSVLVSTAMIGLAAGFELWRGPLTSFAREWFWHGKTVSEDPWDWVNYLSPYLRILDFLSGMLMAQAYRLGAGKSLPSVALPIALFWCGAAFVIYWLHAAPLADLVPNFLFVPAIAPLMLHLSTRESRLSRLLAGKTATFLGEISYSIYIWSFFVITMLGEMFGHAHPITIAYFNSGPKVIGICAMTIVVAYGSYNLIEAPARRYLRTVLSP